MGFKNFTRKQIDFLQTTYLTAIGIIVAGFAAYICLPSFINNLGLLSEVVVYLFAVATLIIAINEFKIMNVFLVAAFLVITTIAIVNYHLYWVALIPLLFAAIRYFSIAKLIKDNVEFSTTEFKKKINIKTTKRAIIFSFIFIVFSWLMLIVFLFAIIWAQIIAMQYAMFVGSVTALVKPFTIIFTTLTMIQLFFIFFYAITNLVIDVSLSSYKKQILGFIFSFLTLGIYTLVQLIKKRKTLKLIDA